MGLTWASLGRRVEVASWGLARGPESRSSVEEGWGQVAQECPHPTALLSGMPDTGIPAWGWAWLGISKGSAWGWSKAKPPGRPSEKLQQNETSSGLCPVLLHESQVGWPVRMERRMVLGST